MYEAQAQEPKRRRDAGILQVTERDTIALTWIAEQFCISFDQLRYLLGRYAKAATKTPNVLSTSATRDAVERWLLMGFIEEPRKIISGHSPYIWLSRRGLSQLELPYAYYKPQISSIKHIYAVNAIRLHLESQSSQLYWYPERMLTKETSLRPLPDAELHTPGTQNHIAIKIIETSFKHNITLIEAIQTLKELAQRYPSLWYFVEAQAMTVIQQALTSLEKDTQERITLHRLDSQASTQIQKHLLPNKDTG